MSVQCPGCKRSFHTGVSYSNHTRRCKQLSNATTNLLRTRKKCKTQNFENHVGGNQGGALLEDLHKPIEGISEEMQWEDLGEPGPVQHSPSPELEPPPRPSGRPARRIRLPARYRDDLPPRPPAIVPEYNEPGTPPEDPGVPFNAPHEISQNNTPRVFRTQRDSYGILREYSHGCPSFTPDEYHTLSDQADSPNLAVDPSTRPAPRSIFSSIGSSLEVLGKASDTVKNFFYPFRNASVFRLMTWFYNSSNTKSIKELNLLVNDVILAPDFKSEDLRNFSAIKENDILDRHHNYESGVKHTDNNNPGSLPILDDRWIKGSVSISLPCDGVQHKSEDDAPKFEVELHYRKPLEIIKAAFLEPSAEKFHTTPFKTFWKESPNEPEIRIITDIFTADTFNAEHRKICEQTQQGPNSELEPVVAGLMIWSDSTSLAQFGTADLWPIYLYFGNQSKYTRAKPSSFAAHHLAYMPKLGDNIQEAYMQAFNRLASSAILTHLRRELVHAVWSLLMDDEFMHAYIHGLVFQFTDKITRLLFPRFLTYSADYPEKMIMACLKYLAQCPCPRCLLLKSKIPRLGTKRDAQERAKLMRVDDECRRKEVELVRKWIYEDGRSLTSAAVERMLGPRSLVPTRNAFSERLFVLGFNFYQLFVVDLLHEFELGVWKAVFTHLIRILYAHGNNAIQTLNSRYRQMPTFGRDIIRKFSNNASGMKKLAARDYEDLLQCAIPAFESLLPAKHDAIVRKLLFEMATWHGLAKLRLHTETTLTALDNSTTRLGEMLRLFESDVCSAYATRDLPSEEAARGRRKAATAINKTLDSHPHTTAETPSTSTQRTTAGPKFRKFSLVTYKTHALAGYTRAIRLYGTTDNYSTQTGELEHRRGKRWYKRVHKGHHVSGIAQQVRRERLLHQMKEKNKKRKRREDVTDDLPSVPFEDEETLPVVPPEEHHHISKDARSKIDLSIWLSKNKEDPALKDFHSRLKNHLLSRLLRRDYNGDEAVYSPEERRSVVILNDRMYRHKVLRVNYTTYDLRRAQDSLNPRTHADIMVLSPQKECDDDEDHPYWYARIVGIFHVNVLHTGPDSHSREPQRMEFLFVRWFGRDLTPTAGWSTKRLHRLGFVPGNDVDAFGFLDPQQCIRAVHLMPAFAWGRVTSLLPPSVIARSPTNNYEDWQLYYLGMFADRDLLMRFRGGGVGHKSTRDATNYFKSDRDKLDMLQPGFDSVLDQENDTNDSEDEEVATNNDTGLEAEDDYGYNGCSEDDGTEPCNDLEEFADDELGPEDGGGGIDEDLEDLGYGEL